MRADAASFARRWWALIIGVDETSEPSLQRLGSAERDARALAAALGDHDGCAVPESQIVCLVGEQATRVAIFDALDGLIAQASGEDSLLIYFAGHGLGRDDGFFLCGADASLPHLEATAVSSENLDARLRVVAARGVIIILDCCESAGFAENAPATFRALRSGEYRILLAAARADQQSWELGPGSGTLFSRVLIDIISGRVPAGARPGVVYFTDLMREIYDRIAELRETVAQDAPPQDPVYAGAFGKDPLLFVHRGLSLGQIELETARYTPGYVRRRVRRIAAFAAAVLFFAGTVYYGWLFNTEYAALDGERITIFNGHPGLNAPGLPIRLWTLNYGAERLVEPARGGVALPLVAPLGRPVLPLLQRQTKPEFRAAALLDAGETAAARSIAQETLAHRNAPFQSQLYASIVFAFTAQTEDVPTLRGMLRHERREVREYAVRALSRLDPTFIYPLLANDLPGGQTWPHDTIVRDVGPPCSPPLTAYLEKVMGIDSNVPGPTEVLDAAVRTGCRLSVQALVTGVGRPSLDEGAEFAGYAAFAGVEAPLRAALEGVLDDPAANPFTRERALATYMLLPGATCRPTFVRDLHQRFEFAQLTTARAMSRICSGHELQVAFDAATSSIGFALVDDKKRLWSLSFTPGARGAFSMVRPALRELVRARRDGLQPALIALATKVEDDSMRRQALESLQGLGVRLPESALLDSNNLGVRRASYELDRLADSRGAADRLLSRVGHDDMFYVEMLGRIPLTPDALARVRRMLAGDRTQRRDGACVLAMQGETDEVATLAASPEADIREHTAACLPFHPKAATILRAIDASPDRRFPIDTIHALRRDVESRVRLEEELAAFKTTPERLWRLSLIKDEPGPGMATGFRYYVREQRFLLRSRSRSTGQAGP